MILGSLLSIQGSANKLRAWALLGLREKGRLLITLGGPRIGFREKFEVWKQMSSGQLAQGAKVLEFEKLFAQWSGFANVIATNSGTSALHVGNLALGLGPGDEVIVPSFTFAASANSIALTGARPVFCDIDERTFTLDPNQIEDLITPKTRAIMVVHLYGQMADMPKIMEIAKKHNLFVIEDAAQAHGASIDGKPAGSWGDFGVFSFYPTKNMTTGEGGAISTSSSEIDRKCRLLRNQGMIERYKNEVVGLNNRMTEIAAVIGIQQLKRLDRFNRLRARNARLLDDLLGNVPGISIPHVRTGAVHVYHQYTILVDQNRDQVAKQLTSKGVQSAVYYPTPVHRLPAYSQDLNLPNSESVAARCLSLPIHPGLKVRDIYAIAKAVKDSLSLA